MRRITRRWLRFSSNFACCVAAVASLCQLAAAQSQVSWNFLGPVTVRDRVVALASNPLNDSLLYLAAPGGGVWQSPNGGQNWIPLIDSAFSLQVCSLAVDPNNPDVVYLGTGDDQNPRPSQGVARSVDGGKHWIFLPRFTNQAVCTLLVDPGNSTHLLAGSMEGLFVSTDSGASWTRIVNTSVTSIAVDGQDIYAGTLGQDTQGQRDKNLAHSSDGGKTWSALSLPTNPNTPNAPVSWISVVAASGTVSAVVAYTDTSNSSTMAPDLLDFYRTVDGGTTWTTTYGLGEAYTPIQVITSPLDGTLYVTGVNLYVSRDRGSNWLTLRAANGSYHTGAFSAGMLILGGEKGLDAISPVPTTPAPTLGQLPIGRFLGATIDSLSGIWGAGPAGLFALAGVNSTAEGGPLPGVGSVGNVVAPASGSLNMLAAGNQTVYRSTDEGAHFTAHAVVADGELRAPYPPLILDPLTSTSAYVGAQHLYHTTDGGSTWTALPQVDPDTTRVIIAMAMAPSSRLTLYVATACLPEVALVPCPESSKLWRSTNAGQTWTQLSPVPGFVTRLAVDPRQPGTVYAAVGGFPGGPSLTAGAISGDLLCLGLCSGQTTSSTTWSSVHGNLPRVPINAVVIDSTSVPTSFTQPTPKLYVATDVGVFVTFNAGAQWTDMTNGFDVNRSLPAAPITNIFLRPTDGSLVAATFGRGVYATSTTGLTAGLIANPLSLNMTLLQNATVNTGVTLTNSSTTAPAGWLLVPLDSWLTITNPTGVVGPNGTAQLGIRVSSAGLQAGTYKGRLQLVSGFFTQNIFVDLHVMTSPSNLTIVAGNNAATGTGATIPLQVMVSDSKQSPLSGISVTFAITNGGGSLSTRIAVTAATGVATTVLTLPTTPGDVKVVASVGSTSVTFTDTAVSAPSLTSDSVVDGVTLNPYTSLAPGSVLAISGRSLATAIAAADTSSLPTVLLSTRVWITTANGDLALQLIAVSPTLVRALLPTTLQSGTYPLRVDVGSVRSNQIQISVAAFDPGIFTAANTGKGRAIFIKQDGSLVSATNPADRGSTISFYASGLGAVTAQNRTVTMPQVYFDNYQAAVVSSGLAPNLAGRYLVTVRVPTQLSPANNISVSLTIGGFSSNRVTIPVR